ncbi:carboxymethylenebutenolidase [Oesophagostomum dentatum]|uniref:Carboxymethylenebutenolidase n=1 Tax=Oesophagostomum dentatum TaxID=61180 RepID=A0A0B1TS92_OESDE|nr:carboxymethylenebutenolidase [Oesophagostomum dentatum]
MHFQDGFVALAADVYGKGKRGANFEENFALMKPMLEDRNGLLKTRLLAAVEAVKNLPEIDPEMIGAIGYCFGGLCALDLARHNFGLRAAVSFHGTLTPLPDTELTPISTSVQVHHGDADIHIKTPINEFMEEMRQRKADWSFTSYGNAEHAFTLPGTFQLSFQTAALFFPSCSYLKSRELSSLESIVKRDTQMSRVYRNFLLKCTDSQALED